MTNNTACRPGCCAGECQDPQYQFELWCRANGFGDVYDGPDERVNLARLDEAVAAYAAAFEKVTP